MALPLIAAGVAARVVAKKVATKVASNAAKKANARGLKAAKKPTNKVGAKADRVARKELQGETNLIKNASPARPNRTRGGSLGAIKKYGDFGVATAKRNRDEATELFNINKKLNPVSKKDALKDKKNVTKAKQPVPNKVKLDGRGYKNETYTVKKTPTGKLKLKNTETKKSITIPKKQSLTSENIRQAKYNKIEKQRKIRENAAIVGGGTAIGAAIGIPLGKAIAKKKNGK